MSEVDRLRLSGESVDFAASVIVAFLEGGERGGGLAFEAEGAGDFGPVEFQGWGALDSRQGQQEVASRGYSKSFGDGLTAAAAIVAVSMDCCQYGDEVRLYGCKVDLRNDASGAELSKANHVTSLYDTTRGVALC